MINKNTELLALASSALLEATANINFSCWEKVQQDFKLYLFTLLVEDGGEIADSWETITNNIASDFQASLDKKVEIWNIYVVFISKTRIKKELKYQIEQNKYSSRKLVFDGFDDQEWNELLPEEATASYLDNKLFSLTILPPAPPEINASSLEALLQEKHASLLKIIGNATANNYYKIFFDKYLEEDEQ